MRELQLVNLGCWVILGVLLGTMGYSALNWQTWAIMTLMGVVDMVSHVRGMKAGVEIGQACTLPSE